MNFRQRFREITDFLKPYQTIWQNEIMLLYPSPLDHYPLHWITDLQRFKSRSEQIKLERKQVEGLIQDPELIEFYKRRKELIDIPFRSEYPPMPEDSFTFLYTIPKKQHEIRQLAPMINKLYQENAVSGVIDIGGGIGLLAQTLVNQYGLKVSSLDLDATMQETGLKRHLKNAKDPNNHVNYRHVKVDSHNPEFNQMLESERMSLGLHTCGPLATAQLEASANKQIQSIVNFGCCYHKLENYPQAQNISFYAKENGKFELSKYALTLASRAHLKLPEEDFDFKLKVKYFRYAIHFLLHDKYGHRELVSLGNSKRELYDETFSTYALDQLSRLNITPLPKAEELEEYYHHPARQLLIEQMLAAGIIRDAFGRLLELYILLDRAIYLEEQGYKVEMLQCFDEIISPRNIGIFSIKAPL